MQENKTGKLVGTSAYSEVREYSGQDVHGSTINHGRSDGLVAKEASGIGVYFTPRELEINKKLQTVVDSSGGRQFIVDFIEESPDGRLVFERLLGNLEDTGKLDPTAFGNMVASVTNGALFLDKMRISHRDLHRIQNIFVSPDGHFKIGDFNLSELVDSDSETGNLESLCVMIRIYVAEKLLNINDPIDNLVDVTQEVKDSSQISDSLKVILIRFLESDERPVKRLRSLARDLVDSGKESWLE